jgi:hypothetical protein
MDTNTVAVLMVGEPWMQTRASTPFRASDYYCSGIEICEDIEIGVKGVYM